MIFEPIETGMPIAQFAEDLNETGLVCLEKVIPATWLVQAREEVMSMLPAYGNSDFWVVNVQNHRESTLSCLASSDGMQNLLKQLSRIACPGTANASYDVYGVLNVSTGKARHGMSSKFHYDASTITLVVPLIMPEADQGSSAEFIFFPNQRPFRRSVAINILDKIPLKNGRYNRAVMEHAQKRGTRHLIRLEPGNAYFFWGYRTLHGALAPAVGGVRATLAIHCGNPHPHSRILKAYGRLRTAWSRGIDVWR